MNIDLKTFTYDELNDEILNKELKENGMLFIHLNTWHALAYIQFQKNMSIVENYKRLGYGRLRIWIHTIKFFLILPWIAVFHNKLLELDSIRVINNLRCVWDKEESGLYRFTIS